MSTISLKRYQAMVLKVTGNVDQFMRDGYTQADLITAGLLPSYEAFCDTHNGRVRAEPARIVPVQEAILSVARSGLLDALTKIAASRQHQADLIDDLEDFFEEKESLSKFGDWG